MLLLNDQEDPRTYFSRLWILTSTPELTFATGDLSRKTSRKVLGQLAGNHLRPVLLAINLQYRPYNPKNFPRWNFQKADRETVSRITNEYYKAIKADHFNINKTTDSFNQSILRAASEIIPSGPDRTTGLTGLKSYKGLRMKWPEPKRRLKTTQRLRTTYPIKPAPPSTGRPTYKPQERAQSNKNSKGKLEQTWQQTLETDRGYA